jgi:hypothetical protein
MALAIWHLQTIHIPGILLRYTRRKYGLWGLADHVAANKESSTAAVNTGTAPVMRLYDAPEKPEGKSLYGSRFTY